VRAFFVSGKFLSKRDVLLYFYLFASIFGWTLSNAMADIIKNPEIAVFFARISVIFPINILNALMQIFKEFPRTIKEREQKSIFKAVNIFTIAFTIISSLLLNTPYNITNFKVIEDGPADFKPGSLYYVVFGAAVLIFFLIIYYWQKNYKFYTKTQKTQVRSLFGSFLFIFISMSLGLIVLPLQGLSTYSPFMFLSLSLLLFILNKNLWIKVAIIDLQEEFLKIGGIAIASIILLVIISFTNLVNIDLNIISKFLAIFFLMSVLFSINQWFQYIYQKNRRLLQSEIASFIEDATTKVSVIDISKRLKNTLTKILGTNNVKLEIFNSSTITPMEQHIKTWWELRNKTPLINKEILIESYFDKDNNQEVTKEIFNHFQEENIDILIPISNRKELIGIIYIRDSEKVLNESDYNNLELLSNAVSVSISRALIYDEVQNLNASLQQKVDLQTKELQKKVKQLEEARRKEADMIDIMGHELRTPMSIVKLNTDLLSNFSKNIPKRKEDFTKYVKRIKDAVDTEIKLINTLLSSAKLEGNQIDLKLEKVDITEKIKMSLDAYEERVEQRDLVLRTEFEPNTPSVYGDYARIVEILNNLIDNAVKYTEKGSVLVKTETEGDFVRTSIIDTGQGMSKDDLSRLGTKFFRTSNYISSQESDDIEIVRPGGTGLGLYVTFNLVRQMGGEIDVKSELGKGSNFSFTLPKYNGQKQTNNHESKDMFERLGLKKENSPTERIQQ